MCLESLLLRLSYGLLSPCLNYFPCHFSEGPCLIFLSSTSVFFFFLCFFSPLFFTLHLLKYCRLYFCDLSSLRSRVLRLGVAHPYVIKIWAHGRWWKTIEKCMNVDRMIIVDSKKWNSRHAIVYFYRNCKSSFMFIYS